MSQDAAATDDELASLDDAVSSELLVSSDDEVPSSELLVPSDEDTLSPEEVVPPELSVPSLDAVPELVEVAELGVIPPPVGSLELVLSLDCVPSLLVVVASDELVPVVGSELPDDPTEETTEDSELSVVSEEMVFSLEVVVVGALENGLLGVFFLPLPHAAMDVVITASNTDLTSTVFAENISNPRGGCLFI